jgi:hypothetical protein
MKAVDYLSCIEPVVVSLFNALLDAESRRESEQRYLEPKFRYLSYQFSHWSQVEEHDDERLNYTHSRAREAHQALLLIDSASAAAAGAILQVARLCVSMAWTNDQSQLKGRRVGTQALASVIWHTRNQALHFEDGIPKNEKTRACLEMLHNECGLDTAQLDSIPRSLARQVIGILGWHSYELFAKDMVALLAEP